MGILTARMQLRRDNDYNYDKVKDIFVPANGEIVLVDTATSGLRAKVGNGYSTYGELSYIGEDYRNPVQYGYYINGQFYKGLDQNVVINPMINKIYINLSNQTLFYFNGEEYIQVKNTIFPTATEIDAGVLKLYSTTGYHTDGTMTQKAITQEFDVRYKTQIDNDNELLIFSLQ